MSVQLIDRFYFPETERTYTPEGYLIVPATISRPGTQLYKASELVDDIRNLPPQFKPEDAITVYRPPQEVFDEDSVNSFKNIAVTNNHPPEFLNSKNHKQFSVGIMLSDVHPEGDKFVKGTIKITDVETINDINDGKIDVSAGYHSEIYFEEGTTAEGLPFQAIQKDIRGNHVAIVARGRAGSEVKLADGLDQPSERKESLLETGQIGEEAAETLGVSSEPEVELGADGVPGSNILSPFGDSEKTSTVVDEKNKEDKELAMELKDAMTKIADLEKANEKLTSQVLDQASIDGLVEDRMMLIDACSNLVSDLDFMGKSNIELKKEVLTAKMPNVSLTDASDEYVNAAFDVMSNAQIKDNTDGKHDPEVYGEDLKFEDVEGEADTPDKAETAKEETKNTHEGTNPDETIGEPESEESKEDKTEVTDSVSMLDSAFEIESKSKNNKKELSAYDKHCQRSRDLWKKN